jgi:transcriptional regulator GlxA family with amidase domain
MAFYNASTLTFFIERNVAMQRRSFFGMLTGIFSFGLLKATADELIDRHKHMKKKTVGILIFDDAEVLDFAGPFEVFSVTSQLNNFELFDVFLIHKDLRPVIAVNGMSVNPHFDFGNHPKVDVLIISGGQGTRMAMTDEDVLQWVRKTHEAAGITLSICSGSRIVGKLGLLDRSPFCTHHEVYEHMREIVPTGKPQKDKRFVQSGEKLFTSGGITAGIDLSLFVVEKLAGSEIARKTAAYMEYERRSL